MTAETHDRDAEVIPLRSIRDRLEDDPDDPTPVDVAKYDRSYEVDLDESDDEPRTQTAVPVDPELPKFELRPIVPAYLRTREGIANTAKLQGKRVRHVLAFWAVWGLPWAVAAAWFALVGLSRLASRQIAWWWRAESAPLKREAIIDNDPLTYTKLDKDDRAVRLFRGIVLGLQMLALLIAVSLLTTLAPRWLQLLVLAVVVPVLARVGRKGKPIIGSAVVKQRIRKLNSDIVLRAYYVAGLGNPDKPDQQIGFGSRMTRDSMNTGSEVVVDLPYGRHFDEVMKAKRQLASGLDVTSYQVFLSRDKTSDRRHKLFVADVDPLATPAGRTPMLDCKPRDIWKPCLIGLDERGRRVTLNMLWNSILVGAQPRKGKTFFARLLALYAASDPWVKLFIADGKNSPDWRSFALVADRMVFGTSPTARDGDPVERLLDMLRLIKKHINYVNEILSRLPVEVCPDGKLTRELARDPRYPELRVWLLVMEEFQAYYELDDQETNKEIAGLLSFIMAQGPSSGVILISSSQKPSGIGSGDVQRLFNRYRDNHAVRFALKCGNRNVSEAVLGTEAYGEGYDASALPVGDGSDGMPDYRGIGYLYGASDNTPTVRTHLADKVDAHKILTAARAQREKLGTLSGEAAGDVVIEGELVDPLADALSVIAATETNISWPRLAARLAEQIPDRYEGITAAAVSSRLRGLGAKNKSVADAEYFPSGRGQGVARQHLEDLAAKRAVSR